MKHIYFETGVIDLWIRLVNFCSIRTEKQLGISDYNTCFKLKHPVTRISDRSLNETLPLANDGSSIFILYQEVARWNTYPIFG